MPEIKTAHAIGGGLSVGALLTILLQQMFAMDARSAENWRKHSKEDMLLHERVARLEARSIYNHGAPQPDQEHVEDQAAAAEIARPEVQAILEIPKK
jgi:hypothetical protein